MQVGQRLGIVERLTSGRMAVSSSRARSVSVRKRSSSACSVGADRLPLGALVEQALGAARGVGRRQIEEGQVVAALVVGAVGAEGGVALLVDQPGGGVGEAAPGYWLAGTRSASKNRAQPSPKRFSDIVEARRDRDQLGLGGAVEVGAAVAERALEEPSLLRTMPGATRHAHGR